MRLASSWQKTPRIVVVRKAAYEESQHPRGADGRWIQGWMGDAVAVPIDRGPGPVMSREEAQRWAANSQMPGPWYHGGTRSGGAVIEEQPRGMDILGRGYYVVDSRAQAEPYGTKTKELYVNVDKVLVAGSKPAIELQQTPEYMELVSHPDIDKATALQIVGQKAGYQAYTTPTGRYAVIWDAQRVAVVAEYPNPQAVEGAGATPSHPGLLGPSVYDDGGQGWKAPVAKYSATQPRDSHGRWTDGRGWGSVGAVGSRRSPEHSVATDARPAWKPTMDFADARAFVAGSAYDRPVYRMSKPENIERIKTEGFDPSIGSRFARDILGEGAYFTPAEGTGGAMQAVYSWGGREEMTAFVRLENPLVVDFGANDTQRTAGEIRHQALQVAGYSDEEINAAVGTAVESDQASGWGAGEPTPQALNYMSDPLFTQLLRAKGYDGIIARADREDATVGGPQVIAFDREQIVVVDTMAEMVKYDAAQPRDADGRWVKFGGGDYSKPARGPSEASWDEARRVSAYTTFAENYTSYARPRTDLRKAIEGVLNLRLAFFGGSWGDGPGNYPYNRIQAVARGDVVPKDVVWEEGTPDEYTDTTWVSAETGEEVPTGRLRGRPDEYQSASEDVDALDAAFASGKIPRTGYDVVAYKGIASRLVADLGSGDSVTDEGYSSVGLNPSTGMSVMASDLHDQVGMEVYIPKGFPMVASWGDRYPEGLLPRGTTFRIIDEYTDRQDFPGKGPAAGWSSSNKGGFKSYMRVVAVPPKSLKKTAWRRVVEKFNRDQPREPKGSPEGGRFVSAGGGMRISDLPDKARAGVEKWQAKNGVDTAALIDHLHSTLQDPSAREQGEAWYREEFQAKAEILAARYARPVDEVTAVIAIVSAQNPWVVKDPGTGELKYPNLETAERFLQAAQAGTFDGAETLAERVDVQQGLGYMRDNGFGANVVGLLNGTMSIEEAVTGAKRRSFFDNGMDPEGSVEVTNDVRMGQYLVAHSDVTDEQVQGMLSAKPPVYLTGAGVQASPAYLTLSDAVAAATEKAKAEKLVPESWTNSQTQATAWVHASENRPAGRGARL